MEALKTKQREELQQHIHQIHAAVSHLYIPFILQTTHAHTVAQMDCISHVDGCTLSAVLSCICNV